MAKTTASSDSTVCKNTLFVRNLPLSTTNEQLEESFSEIGPVKECFVIRDPGSHHCKGYGYVIYAIRDDAAKAVQEVKAIGGRKVFLKFANRKFVGKESAQKKTSNGATEGKGKSEASSPYANAKTPISAVARKSSGAAASARASASPAAVTPREASGGAAVSKVAIKTPEVAVTTKTKKSATALLNGRGAPITMTNSDDEEHSRTLPLKPAKTQSSQRQQARLIVRNLSFKCDEGKLQELFSVYGPIRDVKIPKLDDGKMKGFAFVEFKHKLHAGKALTDMNTKKILDRPVAVDWAVTREVYREATGQTGSSKQCEPAVPIDLEVQSHTPKKSAAKPVDVANAQSKKTIKASGKKQASAGSVAALQSVTSPQRKSKGPQAVANLAVKETERANKIAKRAESSGDDDDDDDDDDGMGSDDDNSSYAGEGESETDEDDFMEIEPSEFDKSKSKKRPNDVSADVNQSRSTVEGDSETDEDGSIEIEPSEFDKNKSKKRATGVSADVNQGRTLFMRNLSFLTVEESIIQLFEKFGKVTYAKIVYDAISGRSKGMAFVQYEKKADADACLASAAPGNDAQTFTLDGRVLSVALAVSRVEASSLKEKEKKISEAKDNRNLFLIREGMIRPGTRDAEGLSESDLTKRSKLEATKRQKLKNPSIFVSTTRLTIHNIPVNVEDKELKQMFLKHVDDPKARIKECRIMRDLSNVNSKGLAKSRGYAFVEFTDHLHALQAVRKINNSPDVYGPSKRPIVEFSLENKIALEAKAKRQERSKVKQAILQGETVNRNNFKQKQVAEKAKSLGSADKTKMSYGPKGLPKHWGPKVRHNPREANKASAQGKHGQSQKVSRREERKNKRDKYRSLAASETADGAQPMPKKPRKREKREVRDDFDAMVSKYRQKLSTALPAKKAKWFE